MIISLCFSVVPLQAFLPWKWAEAVYQIPNLPQNINQSKRFGREVLRLIRWVYTSESVAGSSASAGQGTKTSASVDILAHHNNRYIYSFIYIIFNIKIIPSPGKMGPTVIDKGQPIEPIGSRLRDHTRTFDSGVRARTNFRRTLPGEGKNLSKIELKEVDNIYILSYF